MVEIQIAYKGQLRCEATHMPSGQKIITDAPVDNMGKGEYFSPTDLVATALGTCMLTIMGIVANKNNIDLSGVTARVYKDMTAVPCRRVGCLTVEIKVPSKLNDQQKKLMEDAAHNCPVFKSLSCEINIPVKFAWAQ